MKRYTSNDMHNLLLDRTLTAKYQREDFQVGSQAIFCPYYVPLEGSLGSDWGVLINPKSTRFGQLSFEHDDCGCPKSDTEDAEGWGRHSGEPSQDGDTWCTDWRHECDDWCDTPCWMAGAGR
ncbi:MAG: hypothetical protein KA758_14410 [Acidimicrobiales bacterium]|nr:hypothetical protein [Acidimicrobiales bacterium]